MKKIKKELRFHILSPRKNKYIRIMKGTSWDAGCECYFFDTKKGGLKLYNNKREARNAFCRQKIANKKGLAPNILSKDLITIDLKNEECKKFFKDGYDYDDSRSRMSGKIHGYYTEKVKILFDIPWKERPDNYDEDELEVKLSKLYHGKNFKDLRACNIGVKKGKLVAIDFGKYSFEREY